MKILGLMTCFNRKDKTVNSIKTLIKGNANVNFHFIVVDDASTDGTKESLEEFTQVTIVEGNRHLYYSGGMRLAIKHALEQLDEYDYCLLFNDDVNFEKQAIEKMLAYGTGKEIIVGSTCDAEGKLSYGGVIKKSKFRPNFDIIDGTSNRGKSCDTFNANCVLIPWNIFKKLGNLDPNYSHSLGDFDYGFRASKQGIPIWVCDFFVGECPDNPVKDSWRDTSLSRKKRWELKEDCKGLPTKEWFYYLRKNYSFFTAVVYTIIPFLKIMLKK